MILPPGHFIQYQSSQLHYYVWGNGPRILFAFHGYGESASSFAFIGEALGPGHTLIAIDLPFHGQTEWREGLSFLPQQLYEIMREIARLASGSASSSPNSNLHSPTLGPYSPSSLEPHSPSPSLGPHSPFLPWRLIGYSMGGRIALQLAENHPESIDRLILLAPDGLKVNIWYGIATRTALGNLLFRWTMCRPGWLFILLRISNALRLVNPSIYKFAVHYIDDRKVRHDLYIRWTTMRKFKPDLASIATIIRSRRLPVDLVYGRYDRIIRWERAEQFRNRGIADLCRLILLDTGHQLLRPQFLPDLLPILTA
ncbi:MAG TPA: alpha/beta fold hydrolase [Puia sp.]|nr:alpha/beta fold hydrolase [Puia sp.]